MRTALLALTLVSGCCCSAPLESPPITGTPSDALIAADPRGVSIAELTSRVAAVDAHYWTYAQRLGVCWGPMRSRGVLAAPDEFDKGGDSALFTGQAVAAFSLKAASMSGAARLTAVNQVLASLGGLWYLTNAAGPGVIARCAFPTDEAARWGYPDRWASRIRDDSDYVGQSGPVPAPPLLFNGDMPPATYYTRATKDQLSGILLGLSTAWALVPETRDTVGEIVARLAAHLEAHDWLIRDAHGKNDTGADEVSGLLKLAFLALWRKTSQDPAVAQEYSDTFGFGIANWFNATNNYTQYYAHNLRAMRAFGIWVLEDDAARKRDVAAFYLDDVWAHVRSHQNGWFAVVAAAMSDGVEEATAGTTALLALKSLSLKPLRNWASPYGGQDTEPSLLAHLFGCTDNFVLAPHLRKPTDYSTWQKDPWSAGSSAPSTDAQPLRDATGLDLLLPFWMGKLYSVW